MARGVRGAGGPVRNSRFLDYETARSAIDEGRAALPAAVRPPPLDLGDRARIETILHAPQTWAGGKAMYPTFADQAAVLFYEACKQHAFIDGNKRVAVLLLAAFARLNGWRLDVTPKAVVAAATLTAASAASERAVKLGVLANWIGCNVRPSSMRW